MGLSCASGAGPRDGGPTPPETGRGSQPKIIPGSGAWGVKVFKQGQPER